MSIKYYVSKGYELDFLPTKGKGLLHHSVTIGNTKIVNFLAQRGANIDLLDNNNKTPFYYAMVSKKPSYRLLETLVSNKADINRLTHDKKSYLRVALENKNRKAALFLLENDNFIIEESSTYSKSIAKMIQELNNPEILNLFNKRFEEEFENYLQNFEKK